MQNQIHVFLQTKKDKIASSKLDVLNVFVTS